MKAKSADYIELQNIYKAKARKDLAEVVVKVRSLEKETQKTSAVDEHEIEAFCKGAAFVKLIKGRAIRDLSLASPDWSDRAKYISQQLQDEDSLLPIYISMLLYDCYIESQRSSPTLDPSSPSAESKIPTDFATIMTELTTRFLANLQHAASVDDFDTETYKARIQAVIAELGRAAGAELHNIAALTGGMVAQEVIKVITKQYVPVDNTCVFDGIASKAAIFNI